MIYKESQRLVNLAVENLSSQQKLIYQLSREQRMSQEEIAEKLHISKNTVKSHMNKALQSIRHYLLMYSEGNIFIFLIVIGLLECI